MNDNIIEPIIIDVRNKSVDEAIAIMNEIVDSLLRSNKIDNILILMFNLIGEKTIGSYYLKDGALIPDWYVVNNKEFVFILDTFFDLDRYPRYNKIEKVVFLQELKIKNPDQFNFLLFNPEFLQ